ncbi:hypothetical protein MGN70_011955 [Eutypa lata]|nr:hypothetical protein MGN70_011955 [Eutypa lata]
MYAATALISLLTVLPSLGAAVPTPAARAAEVVSMAAAENWTINALSRTCAEDLSTCTWKFGIIRITDSPTPIPTSTSTPSSTSESEKKKTKKRAAELTPCEHVLTALPDGTPATQIRGSGPSTCGDFTVTSGWSDAGGPGEEFTTISVVDYAEGLIVYPSYRDALVQDGNVVKPDLSFPAQLIPAV